MDKGMTTKQKELTGWDYIVKFNEKLTFAILKVSNQKEITEDDENLLKEVFRIQYEGRYPLFVTKMDVPVENISQVGLFFAKPSDTIPDHIDGTTIEYTQANQNEQSNEAKV